MLPNTKTYNVIRILQLIEGFPSKHLLIVLLKPLSKNPGSTSLDIHLRYLADNYLVELIKVPLSHGRFSICIKPLQALYKLQIETLIDLPAKLLDLLKSKDSLLSYIKQGQDIKSALDIKDHKLRKLSTLTKPKKNQLSDVIQSNRYQLSGSDFAPSMFDGVGNVSQNLTSSDFAPFSTSIKKESQDA